MSISNQLDQITHKVYVVDPNGGPAVPRNVIFPEELQGALTIPNLQDKLRGLEDFTEEEEKKIVEVFG